MRLIIYFILPILLFTSCRGTKEMVDQKVYNTNPNGFGYGDTLDFDRDGIPDYIDVDPYIDTDGDGVPDSIDECPYSHPQATVDERGCESLPMVGASNMIMIDLPKHFITSMDEIEDIQLREELMDIGFTLTEVNIEILRNMVDEGAVKREEYYAYEQKIRSGNITELVEADSGVTDGMWIDNVENMNIVDNSNVADSSSKGTIAYSVPEEMQVGKSYVIKLRITKEKGKEINKTLVLGDRDIPISDVNVESKVTIENIRVEKTMTAELVSDDGAFKVIPQNTEKQVIEDGEYTEWGWMVTPLKSGKTYLKLIIKIKIESDGDTYYKDIVVFDKDIEVKANAKLEVTSWLSEYWQWLMTTIIIPIVVWFVKRRSKNEDNEK